MDKAAPRMAQRLGNSRKTDGNGFAYDFTSSAGRQDIAPGLLARRWRNFLAGPRLQPGPALAVLVLASLALWAAIIWPLYYLLHH